MFTLDPAQAYVMPAHFGPRYLGEKSSGWYHDVTVMAVSYVTDREKLANYLPAPYRVADEAIVTVYYACNKNIDWLAGHGYNMLGVNAAVVFDGEQEQLEGSYSLVIWENLTDPILLGRESQGIPKVYADIPDHSINSDVWRCNASHFGHKIIDMEISKPAALPEEALIAWQAEEAGKNNPMAWRFLPALGGFGEPAVNEATIFPSENVYKEAMLGEGSIEWQSLSWEQNPTQFHIVNALKDLPILEYRPALISKGSTNLVLPERWTRAIR